MARDLENEPPNRGAGPAPTRRDLAVLALGLGLPFTRQALAADAPIVAAIRLADQRLVIGAEVNGHGPYTFIIDTGGTLSGLSNTVATELGLRKIRDVRLNEGKAFPVYFIDDLLLGGAARQKQVAFFGLEDANLDGDGLLAAGMLTALDSELDFEHGQWRIFPPGVTPDRSRFTSVWSEMPQEGHGGEVSRRIFTEVGLNGEKLRPLLDTGAPWPLTIDHHTGQALGLWSDQHPYAPVRLRSIAGAASAPARLVRAATLTIGPATFDNPMVVVRPPEVGNQHPILGLPVIRTLNLSIDAKLGLLWVRRNALDVGPTAYAGSGVWVEERGGKVVCADVGVGSPAAKAGVQAGDVVLGVNTVAEAVPRINPGRGVPTTLKLGRGGRTLGATYSPAAYL
jgi:predicted aspartyl protease